ncbi:MAG: substrate-binding domain-containing protein [Lentisphaerae bacterium]|nr:substrate-binding domain-containing protein [Lentisphaerota bacterium]
MARQPNTPVIEELRERILSGYYDHTAFLPSERRLAEELNVGRGTIRIAIRELQQENLLNRVSRRGICIVKENKPPRLERIMIRCPNRLQRDAHEFFGLLSALCLAASERFIEVVLTFPRCQSADIKDLTRRYRESNIHGIISIEECEHLDILKREGVPAVVVNIERPSELVHCRVDFRTAGRIAGTYLLNAGHRRIGILTGNPANFIYKEMIAGFRGALAEEEVYLDQSFIVEVNLRNDPRSELRRLLSSQERPTAIFATRDYRAEFIWQTCRELNLKIPEDLSVIGYDNVSWAGAATEGLTTIIQPLEELGSTALTLVSDYFEKGVPPESVIITPQLIERSSVKTLNLKD